MKAQKQMFHRPNTKHFIFIKKRIQDRADDFDWGNAH